MYMQDYNRAQTFKFYRAVTAIFPKISIFFTNIAIFLEPILN